MSTETTAADKMAACAELARPAPEHALLEPFVGEFRAKVTMWWQPGADPMVSTGTMTNRLILGGKFIEHDYTDDPGMFQGKGYWGYNTVDKRWEGVWVDAMAPFMHIETGSHDANAKAWEMTGEMTDPASGARMRKRSVVKLIDNDRHTMEMYFSKDGASEEFKSMVIEYTRA